MRRSGIAIVVALLALTLAACSEDEPETTGGGGGTTADAGEDGGAAVDATVAIASTDLGDVLVDAEGNTLYAFLQDEGGESTCSGECAANWPALVVDREPTAGDGVDAALLGTTERDDGELQVVYGDWPLYTFAGDQAPGDTTGQGVGDVWYVVGPDGEPIEDAGAAMSAGYGRDYG